MACYPKLGMNYGNQYLSGQPYNAVYVDNDLKWMWNKGIRRLRIAAGDLGNANPLDAFRATRFATLKQIAIDAKAMGFYVSYGVGGISGLNDTTWNTYITNVSDAADSLWNSGSPVVDEFYIGNELELITSGPSSLQTKIKALATTIKTSHFMSDGVTTFVSYCFPQGSSATWIAAGMGDLDKIGYNGYNTAAGNFDTEVKNLITAFGKEKVDWTEWNVNSTWPFTSVNNVNVCEDETEECVQIYTRFKKIKALDIPAYFFTYRWDQNSDAFSLFNSSLGRHRKWVNVLFDRLRLEATDERRKNIIDHGYAHDSSSATRRCRRSADIHGVMSDTAYTLSIWIFPTVFSGSPRIYEEGATGANGTVGSFSMQLAGDQVLLSLGTSAGTKINNLSSQDLALKLNKWNHIIWRDNNGKAAIYINGARGLRNYNYTRSGTYLTDLAAVGIEKINNFNNFSGRIDELAIFPVALSNAQIRQLYEQGDSNLNIPKNLYLKFDEGSGTMVADSSGNGRDFTLASATGAWIARPAEVIARSSLPDNRKSSADRVSVFPLTNISSQYDIISKNIGLNFGHDALQSGVSYPTQTMNTDLENAWNMGVRRLRIALSDYTYTAGVNATKVVALAAKARGFYVIWGVGYAHLNDGNWPSYVDGVNTAADWAYANGMDEFQLGNEIEGEYNWSAPGALTDVVNKIKLLADVIKYNHSLLKISYAMAQDRLESTWITEGKGRLDKLAYNVYGSWYPVFTNWADVFVDFKNKINAMYAAFGADLELAEWNITSSWANFPATEAEQESLISERANWIISEYPDMINYFFTYRWDTNSGQFGLCNADVFRLWFNALFT